MPRRLLASALALALIGATTLAVATPANAAGTHLYVNRSKASCLDTGPGSEVQPFCSVQAAANVVLPGQTVHISAGQYDPVTITRSGTPDAPITFAGVPSGTFIGLSGQGVFAPRAVTVTGAHDIVLTKVRTYAKDAAVVVDHASHVTIDGNYVSGSAVAPNAKPGVGIDLVAGSDAVTISRNNILNWGTAGVAVEPGVTGAVITTNLVRYNFAPGILATDAPGTVVTSNTVIDNCVSGITLAGVSTGATVENNLLHNNHQILDGQANCGPQDTTGELVVTAGSTGRTVVDHNLVHTTESDVLYSWGGAGYSSATAFAAASGQGTHDIDTDPKLGLGDDPTLTEGSPAIDSADPAAPGQLATDNDGRARADDPLVANADSGIADRGAFEFQDPFKIAHVDPTPKEGPYPLPVTVQATVDNPWSTPVAYSIDFGDGSSPVAASAPTAQHTYTRAFTPIPDGDPGYRAKVTATLPGGVTRASYAYVFVNEPGPTVVKLNARQVGPLMVGV
ncbi:MAG TPA: right-handed parallel beta-helix repeat-containing protein, partial [Kutzneria sp.]